MTSRNASAWDDHARQLSSFRSGSNSVSSAEGRSVQFQRDESQESLLNAHDHDSEWPERLRRRSSVGTRLAALTELGGPNSIASFTRSWQRAAGFAEVIPQRPSFVFAPDQEPLAPGGGGHEFHYGRRDRDEAAYGRPHAGTSLLRQHLEAGTAPEVAVVEDGYDGNSEAPDAAAGAAGDEADGGTGWNPTYYDAHALRGERGEHKPVDSELSRTFRSSSGATTRSSIFAVPPQLMTPPMIGSYGSYRSYGTVDSTRVGGADIPSMMQVQAGSLWSQQQEAGVNVPDGELAPIMVKEVEEEDGKIVLTVQGQSTLPQTIFNSINVLIGVGLLSLPMGIKYAGWICGILILIFAAGVTSWTARILARCMDLDPVVITFSDLAFIAFGPRARVATSILFTMELLAACVALIVLFADSLDLLFPGLMSLTAWKVICAVVMIPLNFLPLRFLSFTSIVGILCCFGIVAIIVIDGLTKRTSPGSLIEPAVTHLFPSNWLTLPLSLGLLMSPWGGHSVFPNIYRDMRHPHKFPKAVNVTFMFTFAMDMVTAAVGMLMFGDDVLEEITSNILTSSGYPQALTFLLCALVAIIPLTKVPLNARPIITTLEVLTGLHQQSVADSTAMVGRSVYFRGIMKIVLRVATILVFLAISILVPAFDSIMAFMGSALCFTICVTLPLCFYLKLFSSEIRGLQRVAIYVLLVISIVASATGTVFSFLPKSMLE